MSKTYRFVFPDGFAYVVRSSEGPRAARESCLRDYGLWARRGRDHARATDLYRALDLHRGEYRFEECEGEPEGSNGRMKRAFSPEHRRRLSESRKKNSSWNRDLEWNEAQRSKLTGRKRSVASRRKMAERATGQIPWNLGLPTCQETRDKQRDAQVGKWKWMTDGVQNKCVRMEADIPPGWWRGRTQHTNFLEIW